MIPIKKKYFLSIPILIFVIIAVLIIIFIPGQKKSPAKPQQLESLVSIKAPFDLSGTDARYAGNIAYDQFQETVFDLYIPKSDNAVPLVIFFHSGSPFGGSRKDVQEGILSETVSMLMKGGVAFVSADYRMNDSAGNSLPISRQIEDCGNLIQFIMDSTQMLGIDPERVALAGEGVGGGIALWYTGQIASEELDLYSISAAAVRNSPASFNPEVWAKMDKMFSELEVPEAVRGLFIQKNSIQELDMLSMISGKTPPLWVQNTISQYNPPETLSEILQHPAQAYALWKTVTETGLRDQSIWYLEAENIKDPSCETMADFFIRLLVMETE